MHSASSKCPAMRRARVVRRGHAAREGGTWRAGCGRWPRPARAAFATSE